METVLAPSRRSLPPVPQTGMVASGTPSTATPGDPSPAGSGDRSPAASGDRSPAASGDPAITGSGDPAITGSGDPAIAGSGSLDDIAQAFVTRVCAAATDFAEAAGAESAMVSEAVPPARHRRSRCRLVLHYADGAERDLTFLGAAGHPTRSRLSFDRHIQGWLRGGQRREPAWLVVDADTADGVAIDLPAWLSTGAAR